MSDDGEDVMSIVIPVVIGILTTMFVAALVALIFICKRRYCARPNDYISRHYKENDPHVGLVDEGVAQPEECHCNDEAMAYYEDETALELAQVNTPKSDYTTSLEPALQDAAWVQDVSGLAPHCLAILKTVHLLTNRLVNSTVTEQLQSPEIVVELVAAAKRIGPRVDDVVRAMYPPLDPRLLEARCSALVLSVTHLVLLTKSTNRLSTSLEWVDQWLADVEDHLQVLRTTSMTFETTVNSSSNPLHEDESRQSTNRLSNV